MQSKRNSFAKGPVNVLSSTDSGFVVKQPTHRLDFGSIWLGWMKSFSWWTFYTAPVPCRGKSLSETYKAEPAGLIPSPCPCLASSFLGVPAGPFPKMATTATRTTSRATANPHKP